MGAWNVYLKERFPLATYLLLTAGIAVSSNFFAQSSLNGRAVLVGTLGLMLFFGELRLMDEYKDYHKDVAVHPERPLPRGVLTLVQVKRMIQILILIMGSTGAAIWILGSRAGAAYLFSTGFLWLMYKEFYVGQILSRRPIAYAITHQVVILPLAAFCVLLAQPAAFETLPVYEWGLCLMSGFFTYEICRKLDPASPPVLNTYLTFYGKFVTVLLIFCTCALGIYAASVLGLEKLIWPVDALVMVSTLIIFLKPSAFNIVEGVATLMLLTHVWSFALLRLIR